MSNIEPALLGNSSDPIGIGVVVDDKYRLEELLGGGASGLVYRATHLILDQTVALKFVRKELISDEVRLARFKREAQIASQLNHPNLVAVKACGVWKEQPYLVMDFAEGKPLAEFLEEKKFLSVSHFIQVFSDLLKALDYAHQNGVIHRDIKPANIMLSSESAKLIDFGLAKLFDDPENNTSLTQAGTVTGTPNYMSPEQCRAESLTPASDLYSLGAVMFESLTGLPPFNAATDLLVMNEHLHSKPVFPSSPQLPQSIKKIVLKAMAKISNERYQSAEEMHSALSILSDSNLEVAAQPIPFRNVVKILAAVLAIVLLFVAVFVYQSSRKERLSISRPARKTTFAVLSKQIEETRAADDWLRSAYDSQRITGHRTNPEQIAEAKHYCQKAMEASLTEKDLEKYVTAALLWCEVARDPKGKEQRIKKLSELLSFMERNSINSQQLHYRVELELGNAYLDEENCVDAVKHFTAASAFTEPSSEEYLTALRRCAVTFSRLDKCTEAEKYLDELKNASTLADMPNNVVYAEIQMLRLNILNRNHQVAQKYLQEMKTLINRCDLKQLRGEFASAIDACKRTHSSIELKECEALLDELEKHVNKGPDITRIFDKSRQIETFSK